MDRELLLEVGVEEMPASWLSPLTVDLAARLTARLTEAGLEPRLPVEAHATPRRLAAAVSGLPDRQEDRDETVQGPPVSAAFDADGHPTNAGLGFARKLGVDFDALVQVDSPRGRYLSYTRQIRGRATVDVLSEIVALVLKDLTFPRQMRWDAQLEGDSAEFTFGRPIRWLLFLYGGRVVPFTIARRAQASSPRVQDVSSGAVTYGHRFLATSGRAGRAIKVRSFDEYQRKLAENFVVLSRLERHDRILRELEAQARKLGGRALLQHHAQAEALVAEAPDLVEFPGVVAGTFDDAFLALPDEVLTTTLIHHQHCFPVTDTNGRLMAAFLAITNTETVNDRAIAVNAERVVTARLRDARFFWDADRAVGLEGRLDRLETVLFHKDLGSFRQKAQRLDRFAGWIAAEAFGRPDAAAAASRAGLLAKADLATDMVREFTELQGTMGGIYARDAGEPEAVWKAIYHHYLPVVVEKAGAPKADDLGEARISWAALALADKLDTVVGLFLAGARPTGSRDPFGLRRQAHGAIRILLDAEALAGVPVRLTLGQLVDEAVTGYGRPADAAALADVLAFLGERLEHALEQRGAAAQNIRAVVRPREAGARRPADLEQNVRALAEFAETASFRQLGEAFKRVRNIARDHARPAAPLASIGAVLTEPAERALLDAIAQQRTAIDAVSNGAGDFRAAYASAAAIQPVVARFFNEVFVMTDDVAVREARLGLMQHLEHLILQLGDISEIVAVES
ncbi:MAG TPA: glycine--tRNA ligase subunit beta [Vicinamibacterales bacterium]|nr:glycine--tRNA ligase subunit beta [Vicinamibacterales bacterium]